MDEAKSNHKCKRKHWYCRNLFPTKGDRNGSAPRNEGWMVSGFDVRRRDWRAAMGFQQGREKSPRNRKIEGWQAVYVNSLTHVYGILQTAEPVQLSQNGQRERWGIDQWGNESPKICHRNVHDAAQGRSTVLVWASKHRNIMAVTDPPNGCKSWRGAQSQFWLLRSRDDD